MKNNKIAGSLRAYLRIPMYLGILILILNAHMYYTDIKLGLICTGYLAAYVLLAFILSSVKKNSFIKDLVTYSMRFNVSFSHMAKEFELPLAILDLDKTCLWQNNLFKKNFASELDSHFSIEQAIPAIKTAQMPEKVGETSEMHFHVEDIFYKVVIQKISLESASETVRKNSESFGVGDQLYVIYIHDETEIVHYIRENNEQRLDIGLLYIDNYEESLAQVEDVKRSLLSAMIDRKINKYMLRIDAITRKLEKDKYIFMFKHKYLSTLQGDKFSLLDEVRSINTNTDVNITISMGIGIQAETFRKRQEYCRSAMDLALARGGDQVVIKSKDNVLYYGGKSIQQEKNTRVKARVKAHAIRESIEAAEKVVIMGHTLPDVDAIGGAIGLYRIAATLGKPTKIVVNEITTSLAPLLELFRNNKDYPEDLFVTGEVAKDFIGDGTGVLMLVVDVNRPTYTDAPDLLKLVSSEVIIDHHRQTGESFESPTLSYIEPSASSASEMVAEIIQYAGDDIQLKSIEADALYSGIMVDTNNFMNKPGVRTFEAVAFLRRCGADIIRIRKMFRQDITEYKVRAEAIQNTEIFMDAYAIATCNADLLESPTIVGAKIADDLLDINGIKASFVLTFYNEKIYISARSIDELNVQVVMEKLGGGGHITSAGAQLSECSMEEATEQVKSVLTKMKEEGEL